jgi:choline dehydrogenase-like flavoprotein
MNIEHCDAVIVGSGFGGAATAHTLAKAGIKTVLLERGGWAKRDELDWDQREILVQQRYRSASPMLVRQGEDQVVKKMHANEVVGGMSVFYGGASLRLRERDFAGWPLDYADLEKYYTRAEQLLGVHGEAGEDPHEPGRSADYPFASAALTQPAQRIYEAARKVGYKPFKIPLAINFSDPARPLCIQCTTCDGFPCKIQAKNDLTATLLQEAQEHGLRIVAGVIVARLTEENGRIRSVQCIDKETGKTFSLSAKLVVVGAGALHSPAILLRSGLEKFAQHPFIGRFLMRHCNGVVSCVFPFKTNPKKVFHKQLCCTDFYEDRRQQFGTAVGIIQDIYTPGAEVIGHFAPRGLRKLAGFFSHYMQNLLCIAEDDPQFDNAVSLASARDDYGLELLKVTHHYSHNDYERRNYLIDRAKKILRAAGGWVSYIYDIDSFSHVVGTLRCGSSPDDSVLDKNCRFWGVENLFVVDGSFMPTSGGVNPSLTIAANAFRVSDHILAQREGF